MNPKEKRMLDGIDNWNPMVEDYTSPHFNSYRHYDHDMPCSLYVAKIPINFNQNGLYSLFSNYGKVLQVRINNPKPNEVTCYGFVDFANRVEAEAAIAGLKNKPPFYLKVSFAHRTDKFNRGGYGYERRQEEVPTYEEAIPNDGNYYEESEECNSELNQLEDFEEDCYEELLYNENDLPKLLITVGADGTNKRNVIVMRTLSERPEFQKCDMVSRADSGADFNDSASSHSSGSLQQNANRHHVQGDSHLVNHLPSKTAANELDGISTPRLSNPCSRQKETSNIDYERHNLNSTNSMTRAPRGRSRMPNRKCSPPRRNQDFENSQESSASSFGRNPADYDKKIEKLKFQRISSQSCNTPPGFSTNNQNFRPENNTNGPANGEVECENAYGAKFKGNNTFNSFKNSAQKAPRPLHQQNSIRKLKSNPMPAKTATMNNIPPMSEKKPEGLNDKKFLDPSGKNAIPVAEITLGKRLPALVSHYVSKYSFWIQVMNNDLEMLQICNEKLTLMAKSVEKSFDYRLGNVCAVQSLKDENWYRGRIDKINLGGIVKVFFIDYGNSEEMSVEHLITLPSEFCSLQAQAIHCKLGNSSLNPEEIAAGKLFWIEARSKCEGIYLVDVLEKCDLASAPDLPAITEKKSKLLLDENDSNATTNIFTDVVLGESIDISVTVSQSAKAFWGQLLLKNYLDGIVNMITGVSEIGSGSSDIKKEIVPHEIVASQSIADAQWYRAVVMGIEEDRTHHVFYIDFGNEEKVKQVKPLPDHLKNYPSILVMCCIKELYPSAEKYLKCILPESTLGFIPKQKDPDGSLIGDLTCDKVHFASAILQRWNRVIDISKTVNNSTKGKESKENKRSPSGLDLHLFESLPLESDVTHEVLIMHAAFEDGVFVGLNNKFLDFGEVSNKIGKFCEQCETPYVPKVNEIVCAKYSSDGMWYRAQVLERFGDTSVKVHFIDYGNNEKVSVNDIRQYPAELLYPRFAIKVTVPSSTDGGLSVLQNYLSKKLQMKVVNAKLKPIEVEFFDLNGDALFVSKGDTKKDFVKVNGPSSNSGRQRQASNSNTRPEKVSPKITEKMEMASLKTLPSQVILDAFQAYVVLLATVTEESTVYICLKDDMNALNEMSQKLQDYCSKSSLRCEPCLKEVVCAKYSIDGDWYRAEVQNLTPNVASVLFIDFGNVETVELENLKKLPSGAKRYPPFGRAVTPRNFNEPLRAALKLHEQKLLNMKIIDLQDGPVVEFFTVDGSPLSVTPFETGCIRPEVNNSEDDLVGSAQKNVTKQPDKITIDCLTFGKLPNTPITDAIPLHVINEDTACVILKEHYNSFRQFICDVNEHCSAAGSLQHTPQIGEIVFANFDVDLMWYRAEVTELLPKSAVVTFIDFGNSSVVAFDSLQRFEENFLHFPVHSIIVKAERGSVELEKKCFQPLKMKVVNSSLKPPLVAFYEEVPLLDSTVDSRSGRKETQGGKVKRNSGSSDTSKSVAETIKANRKPFLLQSLKVLELPVGKVHLIQTSMHSPEVIFCSLFNEQNVMALSDLLIRINDYCNGLPSSYKPQVAEVCLAQFTDETWYRAAVLDEFDNECKVLFVDYGNIEIVPCTKLRQIIPEFLELPQQCVQCCLADVREGGDWKSDEIEKLKVLIPLNEPFEANVIENKDDFYVIEIASIKENLEDLGIIVRQKTEANSDEVFEKDEDYLKKLLIEKEMEIRKLKESLRRSSSSSKD